MSAPAEPPAGEPMSIEVEGEKATLIFRRLLRHPPEVVWKAITDPEEMRQWFHATATIEGRVGGRVDLVQGPYLAHVTGHVRVWEPPRLLEFDVHVAPQERLPEAIDGVIRWELFPRAGGTLLVLTFRGLSKPVATLFAGGLKGFLARLEAQLDGHPLPGWEPPDE